MKKTTTQTEPKIEWWITDWLEYHGPAYGSVALEGEDQFGNRYVASGEAYEDGSVGGCIEVITDIEKIEK